MSEKSVLDPIPRTQHRPICATVNPVIVPLPTTSRRRFNLIKEQARFRPGKSCTSQLLNLTQHIEDGYQRGMITGAAFVDLSAAYNTVNHRILIQKLYNITQDSQLCKVLQNMLSNRRFYVGLNNEMENTEKQLAPRECHLTNPVQQLH